MVHSRRENLKTANDDYRCSYNNNGSNLVRSYCGFFNGRQLVGKHSSSWLYFHGGLTFFISYFQQRQHEIKSRPLLSVVYDPQTSQDTYTPEEIVNIRLPDFERTVFSVERKCLKIAVENNGGGIAERCNATLRLLNYSPTDASHPSKEPKNLLWETDELTQDIGINGFAILYVAISEARNRDYSKKKYPALLATPQTIRVKEHPFNIRAQDVLGEGDFYVEIAIFPKNSDFIKCVFRIHVTNDWHQLSMERIS
jgi:hypothetical protein